MKTRRWILAAILCLCLLAAGIFVWKEFFSPGGANGGGASAIETDGDIVIVIPDEQGDDGF